MTRAFCWNLHYSALSLVYSSEFSRSWKSSVTNISNTFRPGCQPSIPVVERYPKFQFTSPKPGHPIHSDAKQKRHPSSSYIKIPYLPKLHGAETSMIVHPLQLKLLESVIVTACVLAPSKQNLTSCLCLTLTAGCSSGSRSH